MSFYQNVGIDFRQLTPTTTPSSGSTGGGSAATSGTINGPLSIVSTPTASKVTTMTVSDTTGEFAVVPSVNTGTGGMTIKNDCSVGYNGSLNITTLSDLYGNASLSIGKAGLFNYQFYTYINLSTAVKNSGGYNGSSLYLLKNTGKTGTIKTDPILEMNRGNITLFSSGQVGPKLWINGSLGMGQVHDTIYNKPVFDGLISGVLTLKSAGGLTATTLETVDGELLMTPPSTGVTIVGSIADYNASTLNLVAAGPFIGSALNITTDNRLHGYSLSAPLQNDLNVNGVKADDLTLYRYESGQTYNILHYDALDKNRIYLFDPTGYDPRLYVNGPTGPSRVYDELYYPPPAPVIPTPVTLPTFTVLPQNFTGGTDTITAAGIVTSMTAIVSLKCTGATTIYLPYTAIPPYANSGTVGSIAINALVGVVLSNDSTVPATIWTLGGLSATNRNGTGLLTIPLTAKNKVYWFYHTGNNFWNYFS